MYFFIFEDYDPFNSQHSVLVLLSDSETNARGWIEKKIRAGSQWTLEAVRESYPSSPRTELVYSCNVNFKV